MDARRAEVTIAKAAAPATIVIAGILSLLIAWWQPWWSMHARAPQYGKQTLVVFVSPTGASGDVKEIDTLGHYVGMKAIADYAPFERKLAPFGFLAAALGFLVAPITRRRLVKGALIAPIVALSLFFLWDLRFWTLRSVTDRDPHAALSNTVKEIHPRLEGEYSVGQFAIDAHVEGGLCAAAIAGVLAIGLLLMPPAPMPEWLARRRRRAPAGAATAALALMFFAAPPRAHAAVRDVAATDSVAAAIAGASPGDTLILAPGIHREHLTIDRTLSIVGRPGAILDGGGEGTVVRVTAPGVILRGLAIRASGSSYNAEDAGIRIDHAAGVQIAEVVLDDVLFGVFVVQGNGCRIEDSRITGQDVPLVRRGDAIRLWYSSDCRIRRDVIDRSRDLVIWYSSGTEVEDNVVSNSRYGLHYMFSDRNVFLRNRFERNQVGAAIMNSRGIRLEENTFSFSDGVSAYGLLLKDADDVEIARNRFESNAVALFLDGAPQSRGGYVHVRSNLVAGNDVALQLQPLSRDADIAGNAFIGNRTQVQVLGSGTGEGERWSEGGRGNFWSDAIPYDRDGDGVSEIPWSIESSFESLSGNHPELAFFRGTPGADAIDQASRLFPIFAPRSTMTDPHPLISPPELGVPAGRAGGDGDQLALVGGALALGAAAGAFLLRSLVA